MVVNLPGQIEIADLKGYQELVLGSASEENKKDQEFVTASEISFKFDKTICKTIFPTRHTLNIKSVVEHWYKLN